MSNGRPQQQMRRASPEEMAQMQEDNRQYKLINCPPQLDTQGTTRVCMFCKSFLHPIHNANYDGTVGGYCNKLCRKDHEHKLVDEGMTNADAVLETEKYEDYKPKQLSPVV